MTDDQWSVVGCTGCSGLWLLETEKRRHQETAECPHCFTERPAHLLRALASHDSKDAAAELRARILAERADEAASYSDEDDYPQMADRVDRQIEFFIDDVDLMDLTPFGSDRFSAAAEEVLGSGERLFEASAEDALGFYDDAFGHAVDPCLSENRRELFSNSAEDCIEDWQADCAAETVEERAGDLVLDDQFPADAIGRVTLDDSATVATNSGVWADLMDIPAFKIRLLEGIRRFADGRAPSELAADLEALGISGDLRGAIVALARADDGDGYVTALHGDGDDAQFAHRDGLFHLARRLASQRAPAESILSLARLVAWAGPEDDVEPPTISVRLSQRFWEQSAEQRESVVTLLWQLARNCNVVIVGSRIDLKRCKESHDGPAEFSERWTGQQDTNAIEERVERGVDELGHDSTGARILRTIHDDPNERLPYSALTSALRCSTAAISQWVQGRDDALTTLGLVESYHLDGRKYVELTATGRAVIEQIDSETTRQSRLDAIFCSSSQPPEHGREDTREHVGEGQGDPRRKGEGLAPVGEMDRPLAYGAVAAAEPQGLSLVDYPHQEAEDYRCPDLWVDRDAARVTVSAEYTNPMQYWVSIARALTHHRVFSFQLTPERLESDQHEFRQLFEEHRQVLRSSRCLGHLPDDLETAEEFIEALQDAREGLEDLTRAYHRGNYDTSEEQFRSVITRDALGLCGTVIHLLDLADIDVVRELRLPHFSRDFDQSRIDDLCKTIAVGSAIQSRYAQYSAYRQLFETRPEKQEWTIDVAVDAADPTGELIGSIALAGNFGDTDGQKTQRFVSDLRKRLGSPAETRDDAPEFSVEIPVRAFEFDREHFAMAATRMARYKNLNPTREAVSVLRLFVGTPYDAAQAIGRLQREAIPRDIRVSEVREAVSRMDADRLLPQCTAASRRIASALLAADEPLSTTALEDAAEVSRTSITGNGDGAEPRAGERLQAFGVLERTDDGWRLSLPFNDDEERYDDEHVPWFVEEDDTLQVRDVFFEVLVDLLPPGHPALSCWSTIRDDGLPDLAPLLDELGWLEPWVAVIEDVLGHQSVFRIDDGPPVDRVEFGARGRAGHTQRSVTGARS